MNEPSSAWPDSFSRQRGMFFGLTVLFMVAAGVTGLSCSEKPQQSPPETPQAPPPTVPASDPKFVNSLGMEFVLVPKGKFWMGGGGGTPGEKQVEIPHDFYMGVYEVTQEQWQTIMGNNPSDFSRTGWDKNKVKDISDEDLKHFPVENVSWNDIQEFLKKLNDREKDRNSGWLYRLPAEAEWEYACRGGAQSKEDCSYHFYLAQPSNDLSSEQANFDGNRPAGNAPEGKNLERPTKVGSYPPNRLGLHDMHGNIWEWCNDLYSQEDSARVNRGGSWGNLGSHCQAAHRSGFSPEIQTRYLGFRLARVPSVGK